MIDGAVIAERIAKDVRLVGGVVRRLIGRNSAADKASRHLRRGPLVWNQPVRYLLSIFAHYFGSPVLHSMQLLSGEGP